MQSTHTVQAVPVTQVRRTSCAHTRPFTRVGTWRHHIVQVSRRVSLLRSDRRCRWPVVCVTRERTSSGMTSSHTMQVNEPLARRTCLPCIAFVSRASLFHVVVHFFQFKWSLFLIFFQTYFFDFLSGTWRLLCYSLSSWFFTFCWVLPPTFADQRPVLSFFVSQFCYGFNHFTYERLCP